ncbi:ABC transporter substrate-binding protein, partial [Oleiphilus sp. HI0125]|uniref:ABC transporter substrate-binding protein n=1 Tax=Oleiphilus sp. HI0125 TaxID=1822266 RepID=UPI001E39A026
MANTLFILLSLLLLSQHAHSESEAPKPTIISGHALSLYGSAKYDEGFTHFDWVNPNAPKGGTLRLMGFGTFDSLNPYTLKGTSPFNTPGLFMYGFSELNEPLMAGTGSYASSADEVQTAYGLIAQTIRYPDNYAWVEYDIRNEARFHDGHPIDAEDVVYSFYTLIEKGHPRYQQSLLDVDSVAA